MNCNVFVGDTALLATRDSETAPWTFTRFEVVQTGIPNEHQHPLNFAVRVAGGGTRVMSPFTWEPNERLALLPAVAPKLKLKTPDIIWARKCNNGDEPTFRLIYLPYFAEVILVRHETIIQSVRMMEKGDQSEFRLGKEEMESSSPSLVAGGVDITDLLPESILEV